MVGGQYTGLVAIMNKIKLQHEEDCRNRRAGILKSKCVHEYAESQDAGYMYCPDCNEAFKEGE